MSNRGRRGDMKMSPEELGTGTTATDDRFAGQLGYRGRQRDGEALGDNSGDTVRGTAPAPSTLDPVGEPSLSLNPLGTLSEPMYSRDSWLDTAAPPVADHPLLRGLLLELPPKGTVPPQEWLNRWFDAARAVLDLLYQQPARR
ncbi:MAG TPA: hypothetical protein VF054_18405 [Micromonosporaceae bacterium]